MSVSKTSRNMLYCGCWVYPGMENIGQSYLLITVLTGNIGQSFLLLLTGNIGQSFLSLLTGDIGQKQPLIINEKQLFYEGGKTKSTWYQKIIHDRSESTFLVRNRITKFYFRVNLRLPSVKKTRTRTTQKGAKLDSLERETVKVSTFWNRTCVRLSQNRSWRHVEGFGKVRATQGQGWCMFCFWGIYQLAMEFFWYC